MAKNRQNHTIAMMAGVLKVSVSGYYAWKKRGESARSRANKVLLGDVQRIYKQHEGRYGVPRILNQLKSEGRGCSRNRLERLMRKYELRAKTHKRFKVKTTDSNHDNPIAPNILGQNFTTTHVNQVWLADITYIHTNEGFAYLASIMDLHSRKIIGFAIENHMRESLTLSALNMALKNGTPHQGVIHHSDRGSQYAANDYKKTLKTAKITQSMSRKGNCYDNAPIESYHKTIKTELVYHTRYKTVAEAKLDLFKYLEIYYNNQRSHSSIGYKTPNQSYALAA